MLLTKYVETFFFTSANRKVIKLFYVYKYVNPFDVLGFSISNFKFIAVGRRKIS